MFFQLEALKDVRYQGQLIQYYPVMNGDMIPWREYEFFFSKFLLFWRNNISSKKCDGFQSF